MIYTDFHIDIEPWEWTFLVYFISTILDESFLGNPCFGASLNIKGEAIIWYINFKFLEQ